MNKMLLPVFMCVALFFSAAQIFAQEENMEYSWGTVKSMSSGRVTVVEYNFDSDEDVEVTYSVGPEVKLEGVEFLSGIAVDDSLDIEYIVKNNKKIAVAIAVEKPFTAEDAEEYAPLQADEEEYE